MDVAYRSSFPRLSAELYTIPLEHNRYLVYAPLRRAAFVTNARGVNYLAALGAKACGGAPDTDSAMVAFLRHINILDGGIESYPATEIAGDPEPTAVTLFLTTACNMRRHCTYC
jgi:uncharacterized protein